MCSWAVRGGDLGCLEFSMQPWTNTELLLRSKLKGLLYSKWGFSDHYIPSGLDHMNRIIDSYWGICWCLTCRANILTVLILFFIHCSSQFRMQGPGPPMAGRRVVSHGDSERRLTPAGGLSRFLGSLIQVLHNKSQGFFYNSWVVSIKATFLIQAHYISSPLGILNSTF